MKKKITAVLITAIIAIISAFALASCGNTPQKPDNSKSKIDVFAENAEYKEFYDTVTKIENALFSASQTNSTRTTNRIYNAAYNSGKSLDGVSSVVTAAMNKLAADEVAGFQPEASYSMYSTFKGMFASSFSLAKQMGDAVTRLKGKKNFYGVVMEFEESESTGHTYYVIEKQGNHIYQIIYIPENVTKIMSDDGEESLNIRQELFAVTDISYTSEDAFEFAMLTSWGENEQLSFSYGNNNKRIMYGQINETKLAMLNWADGDLTDGAKQISFGLSEEKCNEMAPSFTPLYDYIDRSYVKSIASRTDVTLTQEEIDEIIAIWAETASEIAGEDSPWRTESGVLTGCDFDGSSAEPTETVVIPDNFVMISDSFSVGDKTGTVKNLVIPSSVEQVKRLDNNGRWQTVDASYFDPSIYVYSQGGNGFYCNFSHIRSESPLFKTDETAGMLVSNDSGEAFYLFDMDKTEYDLTGVTLSDNIGGHVKDSRYFDKVKTIKANAKKVYKYVGEENPGEITYTGTKVFDYIYSEYTIYSIFGEKSLNLDLLEIHYDKPCERYSGYGYVYNYDTYFDDISGRLTLAPSDPFDLSMSKSLEATKNSEIKTLRIVADGFKYVFRSTDGATGLNHVADCASFKNKTASELRSIVSSIENKYNSRFEDWKKSDYTQGMDEEYLTFEHFLRNETTSQTSMDDYDRYVGASYYLIFKEKYPGENIYSVIRNVEVPGGIKLIDSSATSLEYSEYRTQIYRLSEYNNLSEINVTGEYDDVYFGGYGSIKPNDYSTITVNIASNAKFLDIQFNVSVTDNDGMPINDYTFAKSKPLYVVNLPVTKTQFESDALVLYRAKILKNLDYETLKSNDYFDSGKGIQFKFAATTGASPLVSNYWVKFNGIATKYLDETSTNTTVTLPSDCDTLYPQLEFTTKARLTKVVVPNNYTCYYLGGREKYSVIRSEDADMFYWNNSYYSDSTGDFSRSQKFTVSVNDTQPLLSVVGGKVYSKDGSIELKNLIDATISPSERVPYPNEYVIIDDDFIAENGYARYTFENVIGIIYNVNGDIDIDLTLFSGLDLMKLQGISISGDATVTSTNFDNGVPSSNFALMFDCKKAEFEEKYTTEQAKNLFWTDKFIKANVTYENFAKNGYCYVASVTFDETRTIQFIFSDSADIEYDVSQWGLDMSNPCNPDDPNIKMDPVSGTDFKIIRFNDFKSFFGVSKAINYHLAPGEKLTDVILCFDINQSSFKTLCNNYSYDIMEKFISWDSFNIAKNMTLEEFTKKYRYTDDATGESIKFIFGYIDLSQSEGGGTEEGGKEDSKKIVFDELSTEVNFKESVTKYETVEIFCTDPIINVNYALYSDEKITNLHFIFHISKDQFYEYYVNENDVFRFRDSYIFAAIPDFSKYEDTRDDNTSLTFDSDYGVLTFSFITKE